MNTQLARITPPTSGADNLMVAVQAANPKIPQYVQQVRIVCNATFGLILSSAENPGNTVGVSYSAVTNYGYEFFANSNEIDLNTFRISRTAGSGSVVSVEVGFL